MSGYRDCVENTEDVLASERLRTWSDDEIEAYVDCLKNEADRHWSIDPHISLKYAQKIIQIGQMLEWLPFIALGMMARGDALKNLGRAVEALDALNEAGALYQQAGDELGWARTRIGMTYIAIDVKRVEITLQEAEIARQILLANGQIQRCVYLEMNVATLFTRLGDSSSAFQHYHRTLELAYQLGPDYAYLLWPIRYNLALLWTETGNLRQAEANFDEAIAIAREQGATRNIILALSTRARLYIFQAKHRKALLMLHEAIGLAQDAFPGELLFLHRIMAECYLYLNRHREARILAHKSAVGFESQGLYYEAAISVFHVAEAEARLANFAEAVQSLENAGQHLIRSEHEKNISLWQSRQFSLLSRIALRQKDYPQAKHWILRTIESCEKGSVIHIAAMLSEAELLIFQEQYERANALLGDAKRIAQEKHLVDLVYKSHLLLASIFEQTHDPERALDLYQEAAHIIEESQKHLTMWLHSDFLADKTEAAHRIIKISLQQHDLEQAFAALERMKSQVLMTYLSNRESLRWRHADKQTSHLLTKLEALRSEYHWLMNLLRENINPQAGQATEKSAEALQAEISACEKQIRAIIEQLYLLNEDNSHFSTQAMPDLSDIQSRLGHNDVLVEYYNDGESYWAFVITQDRLNIHKISENGDTIDQLINKLQPNLEWALEADPDDLLYNRLLIVFQQIAQRLYQALLAWLEPELSTHTRLWIVPYGSLHYVPFNSLFDGACYLIEKHDLIMLPASSILVKPYPVQPGRARILAHSWNQALPKTLLEAEEVRGILGGELYLEGDAVRNVLMKSPVKVLHIAAHGEYRIDAPELSYIQLGDGQLFMDDLLQEDLSYELVVLSGCETGRAKVMPGDELIGIGRGVLVGGAGSLIASLWRVDDEVMMQLICMMYQHLINGATKAKALRQAQLDLLREQPDRHPAHWGPLQLIGDPRPISA